MSDSTGWPYIIVKTRDGAMTRLAEFTSSLMQAGNER
jgi:hypothetical protein